MRVIGLTGGIGSGKSTAAKILADLGAYIIDADRVGHQVYLPGAPGWDQVVRAFGPGVLAADGTIDRQRLGAIVFSDRAQLERLNRIVHPLIAAAIGAEIDRVRAGGRRAPLVVEAAILIEANWLSLVDELWLIVASLETVLSRLAADRKLDPQAIEARMRAQLSDAERRRHADVVVDNSGSVAELRAQLERLWRERCD